jgi:hypothetical protein
MQEVVASDRRQSLDGIGLAEIRVVFPARFKPPQPLLDLGFAEGAEDAMAALIEHFVGMTHELGRDFLVAPLEYLPEAAGLLRSSSRRETLPAVARRRSSDDACAPDLYWQLRGSTTSAS